MDEPVGPRRALAATRWPRSSGPASSSAVLVGGHPHVPFTIRQYRKQIGVILADLSLGTGVFVIGGGVVGVVILLSTLTGSEVGLRGPQRPRR